MTHTVNRVILGKATLTVDGKSFAITNVSVGNGEAAREAREMQAEMNAEVYEAFETFDRILADGSATMRRPEERVRIFSHEEIRERFERMANPTPADKAASILNARHAGGSKQLPAVPAMGAATGTREWLEIRRSVGTVRRYARRSYAAPGVLLDH